MSVLNLTCFDVLHTRSHSSVQYKLQTQSDLLAPEQNHWVSLGTSAVIMREEQVLPFHFPSQMLSLWVLGLN